MLRAGADIQRVCTAAGIDPLAIVPALSSETA